MINMKHTAFAVSALALLACVDPDPTLTLDPQDPNPVSDPVSDAEEPTPTETIALLSSSGPLIAWDFGILEIGGNSPALALTVVNDTSVVSDVLQIGFTGADASQFSLSAGTDCIGQIQLAPGGSCSVRVRFTPSAQGAKSANLSINGGVAGSTSILLSGTGAPPAILSTQPHAFSFQVIEFEHPTSQNFSLVNSGVSIVVQSVAVGGSVSNGAFSLLSTTCVGTLAASANCSIAVRFDPQAFGDNAANLTVKTDHGTFFVGNWVSGLGGARLTVQTTGRGHVVSDDEGYPSINCGSTATAEERAINCSGLFVTPGHALASSGVFLGWGGACQGTTASCLLSLPTTGAFVTASFAP